LFFHVSQSESIIDMSLSGNYTAHAVLQVTPSKGEADRFFQV